MSGRSTASRGETACRLADEASDTAAPPVIKYIELPIPSAAIDGMIDRKFLDPAARDNERAIAAALIGFLNAAWKAGVGVEREQTQVPAADEASS
jgi:hypothetical protein